MEYISKGPCHEIFRALFGLCVSWPEEDSIMVFRF
jgi:hypothetical protein